MRPLQGTTVVAFEQAVAAPFATRQLADLGARVIKIERPGTGDFARDYDQTVCGMSSHFVWLNRSKESLTLDIKRPEAIGVIDRLIDRADVFVQNLSPESTVSLGVSARQLRARFPSLVACDISGYGSDGPYGGKKAYDLMVQAETGLLSINGSVDEPAKVAIAVADISAGMYALTSILSALLVQSHTGVGAAIEISMLEALGEWMGYPLYYSGYGDKPLSRTGPRHATIAPYGPFSVAHGEVIYFGVQNEREWLAFCQKVLRQPPLAADSRFNSNSRRVKHLTELHDIVDPILSALSAKEAIARLDQAGVAHARFNTVDDFAAHPQFSARGRWTNVGSPVGPLRALYPPWSIENVTPRMDPVPEIGQQTGDILRELGYDDSVVESWRSAGVV